MNVVFTLVSIIKAKRLLREWVELAGACSFHFGQ